MTADKFIYEVIMERVLLVLLLLIYSSTTYSQTRFEMHKDVSKIYKQADKKLNSVYQQILKRYKAKETYIKNIKKAQRLWIKFRDAQFELNFPETHGYYNRNTLTDSQAVYLTQLTNERTKTLMEILDPTLVELIAYYPFNGNTRDISGHGNDGMNKGALLTTGRFGNPNSAYSFSLCSYIKIPEMLSIDCSAFTFTAWVKQDNKDHNNHMIIFHGSIKGEASINITNGKVGFGINLQVPGTPNNTQNWYAATINDTLKANTYYFLVARYIKGQKIDFMINGNLVASTPVPNLNMVTDPNRSTSAIGIHTQDTFTRVYCWNGVIDDVRIYSRSITDQEVQLLFHERGWTGN
jgi:uncharacterized protein YecT (DUF1311 family)